MKVAQTVTMFVQSLCLSGILASTSFAASQPQLSPKKGSKANPVRAVANDQPETQKKRPHTVNPNIGKHLNIGGALRFNYRYESWNSSSHHNNGGDLLFDVFRIDVQGSKDNFFVNASYWFQDHGVKDLEHGTFGYDISPKSYVEIGAPYQPFGIMPYPQFGYTYNIPFYLGFGHNSALGANYKFESKRWQFQLGFFKEPLSVDTRYAPNLANANNINSNFLAPTNERQHNEKTNQISIRLLRKIHGNDWNMELGGSAYGGMLYNSATDDNGNYWAAELHSLSKVGPWQLELQGIRYEFNPDNPKGVSDDSVLFGSPGKPSYLVASKGTVGVVNAAYNLATPSLGPVKKLRFYDDYSRLFKDVSGWNDSQMETVGVQFFALPVLGWLDFTWSKNTIMGGRQGGVGLGPANAPHSNNWVFRTNLNIGYYF